MRRGNFHAAQTETGTNSSNDYEELVKSKGGEPAYAFTLLMSVSSERTGLHDGWTLT
jgi:hypothetical protein